MMWVVSQVTVMSSFAASAKLGRNSYSRVSPGYPMAVHPCAVPYGTFVVGHHGLQKTLVVNVFLVNSLRCLVCLQTLATCKVFRLRP